MLPLAVTLRRLAGRSAALKLAAPRVAPRANGALAAAHLRVLGAAPAAMGASPAAWFSSTTMGLDSSAVEALDAEDEDIELSALEQAFESPEPVEELKEGFVDQKPLEEFDLSAETMSNLRRAGVTHLFPVQTQSFDVMMKGADIMGRSKTGSGKTLAFALPIVEKIVANRSHSKNPQALILLPTRELAQQVHDEVRRVSPQLRTVNVVGGVSYTVQENQLRRGVDILVGTPGRIMDLVDKGSLDLDEVQVSVLDEADMMLKFGFQEAVETILGWVPSDGQTVMWSATVPKWVSAMARKFLKDPVAIDLVGDEDNQVPATVAHKAIHASPRDRLALLESVLRYHAHDGQTLVFTETKQEADQLANALPGQDARALHGDLSQGMRTATMDGFRQGKVKTLVCTDIAARGLDIANVELVVQYRLPSDKESFVHRAGRTGRAGRSGTNVVFFDRSDSGDVLDFERRFHFNFTHAAAPRAEEMLEGAIVDVTKQLQALPKASSKLFDEAAEQMLAEQGPGALSAALAVLCGFDSKKVTSLSMLTGRSRMQTVQVEGIPNARELNRLLANFMDDRVDIFPLDGGKLVFDVMESKFEALDKYLRDVSPNDDVKLSPVVELPRMLIDRPRRNDSHGRFGGNGGGRGGRFGGSNRGNNRFGGGRGGRDRDNYSRFGGERSGDRRGNRSRDSYNRRDDSSFDSNFSKRGGSSKRRGNSFGRNSSFGRFTEGGNKYNDSW